MNPVPTLPGSPADWTHTIVTILGTMLALVLFGFRMKDLLKSEIAQAMEGLTNRMAPKLDRLEREMDKLSADFKRQDIEFNRFLRDFVKIKAEHDMVVGGIRFGRRSMDAVHGVEPEPGGE